ncbi:T4 NrdA.1-like protein [Burkholderia phage BcepNazgul]|uniref:T4 NrdA.1-like protein n=1 Tax=Burkholderia phage BcepNazgul TaxID=242861 RepID=Q6UYH1_9CAUD|nr:T4 NrdA.1-like protein [Burkholderia phage BcepNazgul]AAQ63370.1 T4 NrdA.1-like protein [Burkholderia phage BcepNazgul]
MPQVFNKNAGDYPDDCIYIGRPSVWGNPFVIGRDGTREEVIAKYREHVLNSPSLMSFLPTIRGRNLVCFCAPEACHGDVLLDLANPEN